MNVITSQLRFAVRWWSLFQWLLRALPALSDLFVSIPVLGHVPCISGASSLICSSCLAMFSVVQMWNKQIQILVVFHLGSPWLEAELRQRRRVAEPLFAVFLRVITFWGSGWRFFIPGVFMAPRAFLPASLMSYLYRSICTPDIGPCSPEG